jgi:hypothetical protein
MSEEHAFVKRMSPRRSQEWQSSRQLMAMLVATVALVIGCAPTDRPQTLSQVPTMPTEPARQPLRLGLRFDSQIDKGPVVVIPIQLDERFVEECVISGQPVMVGGMVRRGLDNRFTVSVTCAMRREDLDMAGLDGHDDNGSIPSLEPNGPPWQIYWLSGPAHSSRSTLVPNEDCLATWTNSWPHAAAELAVAPEPAHRSVTVSFGAIARAR